MTRTLTLVFLGSLAATSIALAQPGDGRHPRGEKRFERLDADKSGGVTLAELKSAMRAHIGEADANGDGRVSRDEMRAHHEAKRAEWKSERAKGKHHGKGGKHGKGKHHGKGKRFERLDTDKDGSVEPLEIDAAAEERFARLDTDKDGKLTPDEMRSGKHCKHGGKHGPGSKGSNGKTSPSPN